MIERLPFTVKEPGSNKRLTLLSCDFCPSTGHFPLVRVLCRPGEKAFACPSCAKGRIEA